MKQYGIMNGYYSYYICIHIIHMYEISAEISYLGDFKETTPSNNFCLWVFSQKDVAYLTLERAALSIQGWCAISGSSYIHISCLMRWWLLWPIRSLHSLIDLLVMPFPASGGPSNIHSNSSLCDLTTAILKTIQKNA